MAVTRAALYAPAGPVEVVFFPGEDAASVQSPSLTKLDVRLDTYIAQAVVKVSVDYPSASGSQADRAVRAYALYLTFQAAYLIKANAPGTDNSMIDGIGSQSWARDQRDAFLAKSKEYLTEYSNALYSASAVPSSPTSRAVHTVYDW